MQGSVQALIEHTLEKPEISSWGEKMSQRGVERILGKLVTDRGFREGFFQDPCKAALYIGVDLSPEELDALLRIPFQALEDLYRRLDDRICRLHIGEEPLGQGVRR